MRTRRVFGSSIAFLLCLGSVSAGSPPNLQATVVSISGATVNVLVHNPGSAPQSARVRLTVGLVDNSTQVLTSGAFTVGAGGNLIVPTTASKPVAVIDDDPVPINP